MNKSNLLSCLIEFLIPAIVSSQNETINFENSQITDLYLKIDTTHYYRNDWQIGAPQKSIFTTAFSIPNVIVTNTIHPYQSNDTSVFVVKNTAALGLSFYVPISSQAGVSGYYFVDTDTEKDYGYIEFSPNNGSTWINFSTDTVYSPFYTFYIQGSSYNIFTGHTGNWNFFHIELAQLGQIFNIQQGDTVCWRFTFISDSIPDNFDGLMLDDLSFPDITTGIDKIDLNSGNICTAPNPTRDEITITITNPSKRILYCEFINEQGVIELSVQAISEAGKAKMNIKTLKSGIYFLKVSSDDMLIGTTKFIKI